MISQNGWPASSDRRTIGVGIFTVAGVEFPGGVKTGDVAVVLGHVARQFHTRVEPLHAGWCWGFAYRQVTGGGSLSNHASGTAIDINAPDHPYNRSGTFGATQAATIRAIVASCGGVVRWGGDYTGTKDEMHFEIVAPPAAVAAAAARIRAAGANQPKEDNVSAQDMWAYRNDDAEPGTRRDTGDAWQRLVNIADDTYRVRTALGSVDGGLAAALAAIATKIDAIAADVAALKAADQ